MAAPPSLTSLDLSGIFVLNKALSTNTEMDLILQKQGVGWFVRRAISLASITIAVKHYKDKDDVEHIDIRQTLTGGIGATNEDSTLDWAYRSHEDHIFGVVNGRSRRINADEAEDDFLKQSWSSDAEEHGVIHLYDESDPRKNKVKWSAEQVWGFKMINRERRHARHVKFTGPEGERVDAVMIYDYTGPNPAKK